MSTRRNTTTEKPMSAEPIPRLDLATRGTEYVPCTACDDYVERMVSGLVPRPLQCQGCGQQYDPETGEAL